MIEYPRREVEKQNLKNTKTQKKNHCSYSSLFWCRGVVDKDHTFSSGLSKSVIILCYSKGATEKRCVHSQFSVEFPCFNVSNEQWHFEMSGCKAIDDRSNNHVHEWMVGIEFINHWIHTPECKQFCRVLFSFQCFVCSKANFHVAFDSDSFCIFHFFIRKSIERRSG